MSEYRIPYNDRDVDPPETQDWLGALEFTHETHGPDRVNYLLEVLGEEAYRRGVEVPYDPTTPYINTINPDDQPRYPGNRELERRIKSLVRWNAMAMVHRANKLNPGIGGHISTFQSVANLYEVGHNHFFRGRTGDFPGDLVYFQGHASPGNYARAFMEGRLEEKHLENFRQELAEGGGLSSYPHPWLMPDFWQFPTVSMGLAAIQAIYQARFQHYLVDRGLLEQTDAKVWAFLGDGETDEPETLGAITLAAREKLDNLIFVINCNLQRLDGPVRGNGKIIQELEGAFRGAGWNVIKVVWGSDWDPLIYGEYGRLLTEVMNRTVDGEYQKYTVSPGSYIREHFFGKHEELLKAVENLSDEKLEKLRRGGHDPEKVYAAFKAAFDNENDKPTVILAKTVKGYGLGEAGEGKNITHQQKKLNEEELIEFRNRFAIPISDEDVVKAPFYRPPEDSEEMEYLKACRTRLGGEVPSRKLLADAIETPTIEDYREFLEGSGDREVSTTMAFVRFLGKLLKDDKVGKYIVPIVPDESRTFGMEALFRQVGIYSHVGQLYEPVDAETILYYKEATDGQILEEGITEAGSMASFMAAGTAYATRGVPMIPIFIYYSMFGFQRVGDQIWAAGDMRARGFMLGSTAGRTTLNGEGLQHQDGHSHLIAAAFPHVRAYDPAYAYEIITLFVEGMKRMYADGEDVIYYLTLQNENYEHPPMPDREGVREGILKGMYLLDERKADDEKAAVHLLGSGSILRESIRAADLLSEKFGISSKIYSVTSYNELHRNAEATERWNKLHPTEEQRRCYLEELLEGEQGPFVAASDYVHNLADQITPWLPGPMGTLGTDGFGRSDTRKVLRRHFEVDAESIAIEALYQLVKMDVLKPEDLKAALDELDYDPDKPNPQTA
ncbi:MAG: pyruvate dehydrogenase (acetyl-transferring), homodimeric type [Phycisphaerae bacterium]